MKDKIADSAHQRVIEDYFRTTSAIGSAWYAGAFEQSASTFGGMTRYWDITHQNAFTPTSVRQLSRLVGFGEAVEFRECGPIPHGLVSGIRYGLWQTMRLVIRGYLMIELALSKGGIYTADMLFRLTKPVGDRE